MGPTSKGRGGALLLRRGRGGEGKGEETVEEGEEKEGKKGGRGVGTTVCIFKFSLE